MPIPLIESSDKIRAQKCLEALKNILMQFDCEIIPQINHIGTATEAGYFIFAKHSRPPRYAEFIGDICILFVVRLIL